jgi:hypothetical protein
MHVIDADIQRFARTMGEAVTAVCVFGKGGGLGVARVGSLVNCGTAMPSQ